MTWTAKYCPALIAYVVALVHLWLFPLMEHDTPVEVNTGAGLFESGNVTSNTVIVQVLPVPGAVSTWAVRLDTVPPRANGPKVRFRLLAVAPLKVVNVPR